MKNTMAVQAQTINEANTNNFDFEILLAKAAEIALAIIRRFGSEDFRDYVMHFPEEFENVTEGIDNYVNLCLNKEIDLLDLPEDMRKHVNRIADSVIAITRYVIEGCIYDMAVSYRNEAFDEIMYRYEFEDEDIAWDNYLETECF